MSTMQQNVQWADSLVSCSQAAVAPADARSCFCQLANDTYLYGIFDFHNGTDETHFVLQRMAAEILLGQLNDKHTDEEIKEILSNAFLTVEKVYMESINDLVTERNNLLQLFQNDINHEKPNLKYSVEIEKLKKIDERLSIGVTSVIALIHNGKLFVANIGDSRALLCKTDNNCVLRVVQLSVDHSLKNEDELLRLSQLGLNMKFLRETDKLGNQPNTRCLGNYFVKTFYNNLPDLKNAIDKPIIALPEVHGPINLEDSCRFLVLMSDKLYKNLQEAVETEQVNKLLAQMIVEQFRIQPSLETVCQSVIDKISLLYKEHCTKSSKMPPAFNHDTLLIRNFNFSLPNAVLAKSPLPNLKSSEINDSHKVRFNPIVQSRSPNTIIESDVEMATIESSEMTGQNTNTIDSYSGQSAMSTITSQSSNFPNSSTSYSPDEENKLSMFNNKKIEAYVDFSEYYKNVEQAKKNGTLPTNMKFDF